MSGTFVDTSALLAILWEEDPNHDRAVHGLEGALRRQDAFTHNYVHVEAEAVARRRLGAAAAARLLEELLPAIQTVWVDEQTHAEAVDALNGQGRAASLVDQVSFIVMRHYGADTALAFDDDFERAGYRLPEIRRRRPLSESPAPYETSGETSDLVSVSEVAARSGRSVNTIQSWRRRHADFPVPNVELAAGPIWLWSDVSAWIDRRSQRSAAGSGR
jgi:predicted nucleic acid-binding protein/predicted DNA-binding transcriptional regulator AlpA